jgi:hypothetical protein
MCHDQRHEGDVPILSTDISRLIKERVLCGTVPILAILYTGDAISFLSPVLLQQAGYVLSE